MTTFAVSDSTCLLSLGEQITEQTAEHVRLACAAIRQRLGDALIDLVPSYTTVLIEFDPLKLSADDCCRRLADIKPATLNSTADVHASQRFDIPVYYGDDAAPDMAEVCARTGLKRADVIRLHSDADYRVYAIGFAPGFCFLGTLDPALQLPRRREPRARVPSGSVAIAEQQTAVYPLETPGGWHLIGRSSKDMLALCSAAQNPLRVGDRVRFVPIDRTTYLASGGELE